MQCRMFLINHAYRLYLWSAAFGVHVLVAVAGRLRSLMVVYVIIDVDSKLYVIDS